MAVQMQLVPPTQARARSAEEREMRAAGLQANVITYSATISACGKVKQWQCALKLLREMPAAGLQATMPQSALAVMSSSRSAP